MKYLFLKKQILPSKVPKIIHHSEILLYNFPLSLFWKPKRNYLSKVFLYIFFLISRPPTWFMAVNLTQNNRNKIKFREHLKFPIKRHRKILWGKTWEMCSGLNLSACWIAVKRNFKLKSRVLFCLEISTSECLWIITLKFSVLYIETFS